MGCSFPCEHLLHHVHTTLPTWCSVMWRTRHFAVLTEFTFWHRRQVQQPPSYRTRALINLLNWIYKEHLICDMNNAYLCLILLNNISPCICVRRCEDIIGRRPIELTNRWHKTFIQPVIFSYWNCFLEIYFVCFIGAGTSNSITSAGLIFITVPQQQKQ